ncbi:MAG TPA: ABC transporter permease [Gammaproteobacteria bacterium]|nr:ABC transporter permease [Gammaproteobacteria bacterium]
MESPILSLPWSSLLVAFLPVAIVVLVMHAWGVGARSGVYATLRMVVQLVAIGYVLVYVLETDNPAVVLAALAVMMTAAGWIALRPLRERRAGILIDALVSIAAGGVATLALVIWGVIGVEPWFSPRYVVPLAGMIFASSMNAVSLAAERLEAERSERRAYVDARRTALKAALIPVVNSLFAVGLVSLPGMMTGQILSGVSPLVAVRYQIVVMAMLFGASGISAALYLVLAGRR